MYVLMMCLNVLMGICIGNELMYINLKLLMIASAASHLLTVANPAATVYQVMTRILNIINIITNSNLYYSHGQSLRT